MFRKLNQSEYFNIFGQLLPRGIFWRQQLLLQNNSLIGGIIYDYCKEIARLGGTIHDLFDESVITRTKYLLDKWMDLVQIGEFGTTFASDDEKRQAVHTRLLATGGQNANYFKQLAVSLGLSTPIVQNSSNDHEWCIYCDDILTFCAGSGSAGEALVEGKGVLGGMLLAMVLKYKPAHTRVQF